MDIDSSSSSPPSLRAAQTYPSDKQQQQQQHQHQHDAAEVHRFPSDWHKHLLTSHDIKQLVAELKCPTTSLESTVSQRCHKVNSLFSAELRRLSSAFVAVKDVRDIRAFYEHLDAVLAFVQVNYSLFHAMLSSMEHKYIQQRCMQALMQQAFYHSPPLASLIVDAQCFMARAQRESNNSMQSQEDELEEYKCKVCAEILENPVVLSCVHFVCYSCLDTLDHTSACPVCRKTQPIDRMSIVPHQGLTDLLLELQGEPNPHLCDNHDLRMDGLYDGSSMVDTTASERSSSDDSMSSDSGFMDSMTDDSDSKSDVRSSNSSSRRVVHKVRSDWRRMRRLRELLDVCEPGCLVALDIDETLQMSRHERCMLLSDQGITLYQHLLKADPRYANLSRELVDTRRATLQAALNAKRLVEEDTAEVIRVLQQRGCWVFGLTSRYAEMAMHTQEVLLELGINMNLHMPFPMGKTLQDPETGALCENGILFTNANNKCLILNRFLETVVFSDFNDNKCAFDTPETVPSACFFVDDRFQNVAHIAEGVPILQKLGIPCTSFHYLPAALSASPSSSSSGSDSSSSLQQQQEQQRSLLSDQTTPVLYNDVLVQLQIRVFLHTGVLLNDSDAKELMEQEHHEQQRQQQRVSHGIMSLV